MKFPHQLTRKELEDIASEVQKCLYYDDDAKVYDPDKEWDSAADYLEVLAGVLAKHDLVPTKRTRA